MSGPSVEFRSVSYSYGDIRAVERASFSLGEGTLAGVVGPNGSGKSTLLKLSCGLMEPSEGEVMVLGGPLSRMPIRQRALHCSYCPQEPAVTFPFTVQETVMFGRTPRLGSWGLTGDSDRKAVSEALEMMDVLHLASRTIDELSGGERKRVMLARAVAQETGIMILDEPTSGLDIGHQVTVMSVLKRLARQGKLIITSMHDLNEASTWCDTILFMNAGEIMAFGTPGKVLTGDNILRAFGVVVKFTKTEEGSFFIMPSVS